jgi:SAM-dependent methyltransferase
MKERLVELLVCPPCRSELRLSVQRFAAGEIIEGRLDCPSCGATYPVTASIPRFVSSGDYADSFGFQWHAFRGVQIDSLNGTSRSADAFAQIPGLRAGDVRARLVLDAGVGAGRYADVVSRWGAEVVGVDLTGAVDAAYANIGRRSRVHLVQADIFALPFRDESFEIAYSIGVLHHTPATERAFECVSARVRPGGTLAVYVYPALGLSRHFSDAWRRFTTRLPRRLIFYASVAAVPLYFIYRVPVIGKVLQTVVPISMHADWRWRWLDTFDWYTPAFQHKHAQAEVWDWFHEAGFHDIRSLASPICMRGTKAPCAAPLVPGNHSHSAAS